MAQILVPSKFRLSWPPRDHDLEKLGLYYPFWDILRRKTALVKVVASAMMNGLLNVH
jgi:hypothetical protein